MNAKVALKDILALSEEDRRWLVEQIAASLPEQEEDIELTPEFKAELERRMADLRAHPDIGIPWEEVRKRVQAQLRV